MTANFYVLYNMHWEPHMFGLPHLPKGAKWHVICARRIRMWKICRLMEPEKS